MKLNKVHCILVKFIKIKKYTKTFPPHFVSEIEPPAGEKHNKFYGTKLAFFTLYFENFQYKGQFPKLGD